MRDRLREWWSALLRLGFRLLYEELAWSYDAVSWLVSFGAWREWQRAALPFVQGPDVLEIAHGPGHMLLALHEAGYRVTGLDRSRQMGALSQRRLRRASVQPSLVHGEAQGLPFPAGSFDSVLSTFPTDFVIAAETLRGIRRVLKKGGRLVIVPEAHFTGGSLAEQVVEWLYVITGQRSGRVADKMDDAVSSTFWTPLRRRFARVGFSIETHFLPLQRSEVTVIIATREDRTVA